MAGVQFVLGVHAQKPVGNFPRVLFEGFRRPCVPFLEILSGIPQLPAWGVLYDRLDQGHAKHLDRLAGPIARRQLGLLAGGRSESIMAAVPGADKVGQIERTTPHLKRRFGAAARVMRLAERLPRRICLLPARPMDGPAEGRRPRFTVGVETREVTAT
jgi:hypothetical protein